jgi:hypothetical protein
LTHHLKLIKNPAINLAGFCGLGVLVIIG